jgi:carbon storage regulator
MLMLVLSRKIEESIMIGDDIEIVVLSTEGDTVKIGIKAPKNVEIFRKEIYENIEKENREALFNNMTSDQLKNIAKNLNSKK